MHKIKESYQSFYSHILIKSKEKEEEERPETPTELNFNLPQNSLLASAVQGSSLTRYTKVENFDSPNEQTTSSVRHTSTPVQGISSNDSTKQLGSNYYQYLLPQFAASTANSCKTPASTKNYDDNNKSFVYYKSDFYLTYETNFRSAIGSPPCDSR